MASRVSMLLLRLGALFQLSLLALGNFIDQSNTGTFSPADIYSSGPVSPVEELSSLSNSVFTVFTHPVFPQHSVRIKKSHFCDDTVG